MLNALKMMPQNLHAHTSEPAVDIAPFLNINSGGFIHSIAGTLGSPFDFMLAELNRRYPKDWDHAVNEREGVFRKELNNLFSDERFAKAENPLKLRIVDDAGKLGHWGGVIAEVD